VHYSGKVVLSACGKTVHFCAEIALPNNMSNSRLEADEFIKRGARVRAIKGSMIARVIPNFRHLDNVYLNRDGTCRVSFGKRSSAAHGTRATVYCLRKVERAILNTKAAVLEDFDDDDIDSFESNPN
jgi:hypothetical protein